MFENRSEAGKKLAAKLKSFSFNNPIVIALPRGGVPVAAPIAETLNAPMDVLVVCKIGAPQNPEFGIGAVSEDGPCYLDQAALEGLEVTEDQLQEMIVREMKEVVSRVKRYRGNRPLLPVEGRDVILVDDGLATGVTAKVGIQFLQEMGARRVILAVPTCARPSAKEMRDMADDVICLSESDQFFAVGYWYEDFDPVSDDEVHQVLSHLRHTSRSQMTLQKSTYGGLGISQEMELHDGDIHLSGHFNVPSHCSGIILFAHGGGSGKMSPRNMKVAQELHQRGMGTLLFDLMNSTESNEDSPVDVSLLSHRLQLATRWVQKQKISKKLPLGYFGASTGAAAALSAAAALGPQISAVVSRGGRPDFAFEILGKVPQPTLLIVGGNDPEVLILNERALTQLHHGTLKIIPNCTHLFEEPGALERVAELTGNWFKKHFGQTKISKAG